MQLAQFELARKVVSESLNFTGQIIGTPVKEDGLIFYRNVRIDARETGQEIDGSRGFEEAVDSLKARIDSISHAG